MHLRQFFNSYSARSYIYIFFAFTCIHFMQNIENGVLRFNLSIKKGEGKITHFTRFRQIQNYFKVFSFQQTENELDLNST